MKKLLLSVLVVSTSFLGIMPATAGTVPDEQFNVTAPADGVPSIGIMAEDTQKLRGVFSRLQGFTSDGNIPMQSKVTSVVTCNQYGPGSCSTDKMYYYHAVLGKCKDSGSSDCVSSVKAKNSAGDALQVNFVEEFPGRTPYEFVGDPSANLPSGGSSFIVSIPGAPHAGGDQYLVNVALGGAKQAKETQFATFEFQAAIFAVRKDPGNYLPPHPELQASGFPFFLPMPLSFKQRIKTVIFSMRSGNEGLLR